MATDGDVPTTATADDNLSGTQSDADKRAQLTELIAQAAAEYAVKHYSEAAELYSQATELQAELNGEMATENADLYYSYGKCLFFLAQQTSSVLGGTAASAQLSSSKAQKSGKKRKANGAAKAEASANNGGLVSATSKAPPVAPENRVPNVGDVVPREDVQQPLETASDKPYFQISGDAEGWDDSEEDEADEDEEAEEEEDDDFATSYEFLDLARVLYLRKLDQSQEHAMEDSEKGKYVASIDLTPEVKSLKARVAEIYDLQAEVELEGEKYSDAAANLSACLALREELERPESSILAECHYKLSLALEFSASSEERDAGGNPTGKLLVDWKIRNEAIAQQEKAIDVCKLRVAAETAALDKLDAGPAKDKAMAQIEDVQDMIAEMEVRLEELRKPPVSVKAESENEMKQQIQGVLGSLLGSSVTEEEKKEKLAEVTEKATDISGMIKRKKPKATQSNGGESGHGSAASTPAAAQAVAGESSLGKRKVEFVDEEAHAGSGKKAKVEDTEDSGL
jgi:HAT1-interacting factor 1